MAYILMTISILLALWLFRDDLFIVTNKVNLNLIVGMAAIASGVSGVIMSFSSKRTALFEAVREYYQTGDTPEMIDNRNKIYAAGNGEIELDIKAASEICSFFNFWGMMVRKKFLPIWVFKSASGPSIVRLYIILEDFITERRKTNNEYYALEFEYLIKRIKNKYNIKDMKHTIEAKEILDESLENQSITPL
ncbi:DUF4760 domain-containing protein [Chryseomicrobium excrementi]|uniref:DUF4760 domain-containing protein n=1 Tax=Chryseomicrobium excrementi TaxID=2041346 RepID=UPI0010553E4C|nr:hypothetical protein [Chryseomicrobium excrementi]